MVAKTDRPTRQGFGLTAHVPADDITHRTKPERNRVKAKAIKPGSTKPRAHRVGRSKR